MSANESQSLAASTQHDDCLLRHDSQHVCTLTLNKPERYNALSEELLNALQEQLDSLRSNENIKVVVIAAKGKAFCAGHDLKQMMAQHDQGYYEALFKKCGTMMQSIVGLEKPVIAKVEGMATAAGCQLVATCDLAVASDDARFAVSGINLGLFCSTPSVALTRNVSRKRAFEMLFTGDFIDAGQALEMGLINRSVPRDQVDSVVENFCTSICSKPAVAVATGKRMFYRQIEMNLADAYQFAGDTMACNMMAEDTVEGVEAFIEKREPSWQQ